jgi:hypothetical protein
MLTFADVCSRIEECVAELKDNDDEPVERPLMRSSRTGLKLLMTYYYALDALNVLLRGAAQVTYAHVCSSADRRMLTYADVC